MMVGAGWGPSASPSHSSTLTPSDGSTIGDRLGPWARGCHPSSRPFWGANRGAADTTRSEGDSTATPIRLVPAARLARLRRGSMGAKVTVGAHPDVGVGTGTNADPPLKPNQPNHKYAAP